MRRPRFAATPETRDELSAACEETVQRVIEIEYQIIATRATTLEGLTIKRRYFESVFSDKYDDPFTIAVLRSIYADAEHCLARCGS